MLSCIPKFPGVRETNNDSTIIPLKKTILSKERVIFILLYEKNIWEHIKMKDEKFKSNKTYNFFIL